jgi:hypothetical protein
MLKINSSIMVIRSYSLRILRSNMCYNSKLLSQEHLCFQLVVRFIVLETIGSVRARRVSGDVGRDVTMFFVKQIYFTQTILVY